MNAKEEGAVDAGASSTALQPGSKAKKSAQARTRKRSFFGKASKPSLPTEPVPSHPSASDRSESSRESIATPKQTPSVQLEEVSGARQEPPSPRLSTSPWQVRGTNFGSAQASRHSHSAEQGNGNWYQRGIFRKNGDDRNRSPSASGSIASSRKPSLPEVGQSATASYDTEGQLRSPSRVRRTFSRRSVYSINQDEEGERIADGGEEVNGKPEKRKWSSRYTDVGPSAQHEEWNSSSVRKEGFLQRARSRSIFRGNDASASTESLTSVGSSVASHKNDERKGYPLPAHLPIKHEAQSDPRSGMPDTLKSAPRGSDQRNLTVPPHGSEGLHSADGIPKRLSGWLLNILGGEGSSPIQQQMPTSSEGGSSVPLRNRSSTNSMPRTHSKRQESDVANAPGAENVPSSQRAVKTGMLSSLAASGRARMDQTTSNPAGNFARTGFDRALRYFIDNHEQDGDADEGIWLLGVWHGSAGVAAVSSQATGTGPTLAAPLSPESTGQRDKISGGPESSNRGSDHGLDDDSSNASIAARGVKRVPSSITSATSNGSAIHQKGGEDQEMNATACEVNVEPPSIAHNPPTPHTSPLQGSSAKGASRLGKEPGSGAASRLLSAMAVGAEKTETFQSDFHTRVWCTYRSHFTPIARDGSISRQAEEASALQASVDEAEKNPDGVSNLTAKAEGLAIGASQTPSSDTAAPIGQGGLSAAFGINPSPSTNNIGGLGEKMGVPNLWNRAAAAAQAYGLTGRAGLTTDAGWGCMLRTGQSVLANALLSVHLGREWRRPAKPLPLRLAPSPDEAPASYTHWREEQERYAKYARIISWFMDEPSRACPFGVHRMAREGKRLGKEVGEWFGPSTASGAIKRLVDEFPQCGLGVNVASDGVVYLNQIRAAAMQRTPKDSEHDRSLGRWTKPVLILIGVRLGLEGVHPMYLDSVKATFSFPQSVGIAGGRPSSSYYFVGYQGNSLFYLDPHQVRPSVPFRHPPPPTSETDEWWAQAYNEQDLATFHTDKPRRMPMKSLDPSMLLGFLIKDEASLDDFVARVKALSRPIFAVQDSMPKWMTGEEDELDQEEERAIESISEGSFDLEDDLSKGENTGGGARLDSSEVNTVVGVGQDSGTLDAYSPSRAVPVDPHHDHQHATSADVETPRSEGTFEIIDPVAPPTAASNHMAPISFPSIGESAEDEEILVEHAADESFDEGQGFITEDGAPVGHANVTSTDVEADSTWEDLQNDLQSSPASIEHATAIGSPRVPMETIGEERQLS